MPAFAVVALTGLAVSCALVFAGNRCVARGGSGRAAYLLADVAFPAAVLAALLTLALFDLPAMARR